MVNANPLVELQTAALLLRNPKLFDDEPDLPLMFDNPLAKSAVNTMAKLAKDGKPLSVEVVAHLMGRNGAPDTTPQLFNEKILVTIAPEWGEPNVGANIDLLRGLWIRRRAVNLLTDATRKLNLSDDPSSVFNEIYTEAVKLDRHDKGSILSTNSWMVTAAQINERQRAISKSGILATLPGSLEMLHTGVGRIPDGIVISHLGWTGGGKTMLAQQAAHWLAKVHGRRVVYLPTEITTDAMLWRYMVAEVEGVTFQMFQDGVVDFTTPAIAKALKPYESGGEVLYIDGGGMSWQEAIALSRKYRYKDKSGREVGADLILDYPDAMGARSTRSKDSYTLAIGEMLDGFKAHGQRWKNLLWCVWQVGKEEAGLNQRPKKNETGFDRANRLRPKDAMNSVYPSQKSNLFLISDGFSPLADPMTEIRNPFTGELEKFRGGADCYSPVGVVRVAKNTFGQNGHVDVVWRNGPRLNLSSVPNDKREFYRGYI